MPRQVLDKGVSEIEDNWAVSQGICRDEQLQPRAQRVDAVLRILRAPRRPEDRGRECTVLRQHNQECGKGGLARVRKRSALRYPKASSVRRKTIFLPRQARNRQTQGPLEGSKKRRFFHRVPIVASASNYPWGSGGSPTPSPHPGPHKPPPPPCGSFKSKATCPPRCIFDSGTCDDLPPPPPGTEVGCPVLPFNFLDFCI